MASSVPRPQQPELAISRCPKCDKRIDHHCKSPTCSWWFCTTQVAAGERAGCGSYGYDAYVWIDGATNKRAPG